MTGYISFSLHLNFPLSSDYSAGITMAPSSKELEKVIVSSSRTDSRIENTPTRVEVLGSEEVDEESGVKPAHVASLLGDVAGIQTQQTSAITGNTDLRIQGLPGDYTQFLRDGMPVFGGYSGSFSILQIPPLDLKQIEIIKGASSTLYGGGAIAGMINIISRTPQLGKQERFLLLNQSTLKETNIDIYLSERDRKWGYTFFAAGTYQKSVDVNKDGFSDLPITESVELHPRFFLYPNEKNTIALGITTNFEERKGGDMLVLRNFTDAQHQFYILNRSFRNTLDFVWEDHISNKDKLTVKGIASWYYRNIGSNTFGMKGKQLAYYTEVSYLKKLVRHDIVAGLNFNGEKFKKLLPDSTLIDNYDFFTVGIFVQDDWRLHRRVTLESGIRTDFHNEFGTFVLPRISLLFKITAALTTRLGGGLGYKIPTIFHSEIDERDYRHLSFDKNPPVKAERSAGVNWDVNFKKKLGKVDVILNQSFYYTRIGDPLVAVQQSGGIIYHTEAKPIVTKGFETWIQIAYKGLDAYLGYTLTDTRKKYDAVQPFLELSVKNKFASVISY
jgi:outer membrane receptor for ferrienterochelin and colicin